MQLNEEQIRIIFGLKLRQIRGQRDLSLLGLAKITGLSKSYLNEIEKGKKYPKPDKIVLLSKALEVPYDEMVSMKLSGTMAPLSEIILSGVLKDIPLSLFGIDENDLIDIIANAPEKVTAFISTLFEIARHYKVSRENFYLAALRSYQESHDNYFEDLEASVQQFTKRYGIDLNRKLSSSELEEVLREEFGYEIDYQRLQSTPFPEEIRSVFLPVEKKLLIAPKVSETQRVFILAKELGYAHLGIVERPLTFTWIKFNTFEDVLNNFKASYFAGALLLPEGRLVADLKVFFKRDGWSGAAFLSLMEAYTESAETFFQRLTNLLPRHFGFKDLFFQRFEYNAQPFSLKLNKELHLSGPRGPQASGTNESYCRRWLPVDLLVSAQRQKGQLAVEPAVQYAHFEHSDEVFLVLAARSADPFNENRMRSVSLGLGGGAALKRKIAFAGSGDIVHKKVGLSCESCPISDCELRVNEAVKLEAKKRNAEIERLLESLSK